MMNERDILTMKREQFRVEIRRKQMEDAFNEKRRQLLTKQPDTIEEEDLNNNNKIQKISNIKYSCEFFLNLLGLEMNEDNIKELNEILESVQYELSNGKYVDFL